MSRSRLRVLQAARAKAEELMQAAIENEAAAKAALEDEGGRLADLEADVDADRAKVRTGSDTYHPLHCDLSFGMPHVSCTQTSSRRWRQHGHAKTSLEPFKHVQVTAERDALEAMRIDFEAELQARPCPCACRAHVTRVTEHARSQCTLHG